MTKNPEREQIVQRIKDFLDQGGDTQELHQIMGQAMSLRSVPYELMAKLMQRHPTFAKLASPEGRRDMQAKLQQAMEQVYKPSPRAFDPKSYRGEGSPGDPGCIARVQGVAV